MKTWLFGIQQQVSRQILSNKLPHALLFSGVDGAGHEDLAQWLIKVLLCQKVSQEKKVDEAGVIQPCGNCKTCMLFANANYPDHLTVVNEKNTIGVDAIRKLSRFFEITAHIGSVKTAIVNHAETMTISAANALLKTLEEPTDQSFIILTTDSCDMLLPTIISRCQKIEIRPPVGEKLLLEYGKKNEDVFVNLSHLNEITDETASAAFKAFRGNVEKYLSDHQYRTEILTTLVEHNDGFRWLEKILVDLMRKQSGWPVEPCQNEKIINLNKQQLWQVYILVQAANIKLKTLVQVNQQFLCEKLLADISVALRDERK
ncbi:MAG: DNA polymerase III subunit [Cognaticolwellia sp.]